MQNKFIEILAAKHPDVAKSANPDEVDTFVKNAHHLRVLRGKQLGAFDQDREAIGQYCDQPRLSIVLTVVGSHFAICATKGDCDTLGVVCTRNVRVTKSW